jgi:hypothetical protein
MSTNTQKLRALRARTDHDLLVVVSRELDRGLALVDAAATRNSSVFPQAERSLTTATALLSGIPAIGQDDRQRIETKAGELRSRLERVPVYASMRPFPASVAS